MKAAQAGAASNVRILGRIQKSDRAEIRVLRQVRQGRDVVDVRVWELREGAKDYTPTKRGVQFDASRVADILEALGKAQ